MEEIKEFIDENYFSLTIDCKREINEIYKAIEDYAKAKQLTLTDVNQQRELLLFRKWQEENWKDVYLYEDKFMVDTYNVSLNRS